ncbi:two-component sensor histidine kinase [Sphingomonas paucimobilis]|uniref:histidine kinase n=3 Tax=Sphingomonas paucimobilis TaxID=13689 RepID=A0A411LGV3_SPHPI|nr:MULTISPECIES: PAS domain-containing sensor histidine kinase [Sphingomonas]MBQ1481405.1 PAS-domain containing protein [Sphingomonas sp.]MCM3677637.1 PAS-domain containing protein [Sphingomonas paucimobilis]MDG5972264.1 PAS domain-containing sensor histidine kinase [Sphingomonas paucimobilis]NNG57757.1 histidine kinase [Sphingomonas paucimobilis]QBE91539.1 PAS domain-containing sensor histidine kinase [Sphingomonas paucimobilis]
MITINSVEAVLLGAGACVLILVGTLLLFLGLRARSEAGAIRREHERLDGLLRAGPAQAMLVCADGRIEMPARLADWLGLVDPARFLEEMTGDQNGLAAEDAALLAADLNAAQKTGRRFRRIVRPQGSARTLVLEGARAPQDQGASGAVVVWALDMTEAQDEIARLDAETRRLGDAFEALTGLIEAAPLPMWYRGTDLRLAMVNTAYVDAVEGRDAADVVARGLELVEGSGRGGPLAGAAAARDQGRPHEQVLPATIDGARRALRIFDVPLTTGGIAGFAVDIEDLEQSRAGAKRFAEAQRAMLDRLSAAVAHFGPDRELVFCNQPFRRMFAMRAEWLADHPEFDRVLERMREANRSPEVRDFPGWKAERIGWFRQAGGGIEEQWHLPGGTHLRVVAQPLPDGGLLLIFEDRTEEVQLASARDTLLRVRTATFDNLFEALGVFAADGRLQLWNNRFRVLWGLEEEFLSSHPRVDVFADKVAGRLATPNRSALIVDLVRSATIERQQRGGRVAMADGRHYEFAGVPLPDGNALITLLDITDSRRAEQALRDRANALEAADKVKTAFVANMSYELRTPLTSISGFAEMLHGGFAGPLPETANSYVEAILESTERLGLLVDDVLDLTRGGEGAEIEREDVDLARVARTAADTIRPVVGRRRLDFAVEIQRSVGRVTGDRRRLQEVIEHLLRHAVEQTPESGRILLHADGDSGRARIIVSDDGQGMNAEAVAHAFDRFAEPEIKATGERALGLGLPLAKQFVEAHGGTITLLSEPGQGTLVTVELPRRVVETKKP